MPVDQKPSPDGYYQFPLHSDEVWPKVATAFDFIGYRDQSYFPGGWVSCREDGAAYYSIDSMLKTRDKISSSGYVVSTLEAALWGMHPTCSFEDAIVLAANLGDDFDTVAAVAGQFDGALYGGAGIPRRWLEQLAWAPEIASRIRLLLQARKTAANKANN
jgi:hypothetical protein